MCTGLSLASPSGAPPKSWVRAKLLLPAIHSRFARSAKTMESKITPGESCTVIAPPPFWLRSERLTKTSSVFSFRFRPRFFVSPQLLPSRTRAPSWIFAFPLSPTGKRSSSSDESKYHSAAGFKSNCGMVPRSSSRCNRSRTGSRIFASCCRFCSDCFRSLSNCSCCFS